MIDYRTGNDLDLDEVIDVYVDSTLGERRPVDDRERMAVFGEAGRARWKSEFDYDLMLGRVESYIQSLVGEASEVAC